MTAPPTAPPTAAGGRYIEDGSADGPVLVAATADHPGGARARDAEGHPIHRPPPDSGPPAATRKPGRGKGGQKE
ncbi:MAG: hypothetical protein OHK0024_24400 [Thalassobaculales bacterium]